MIVPFFRSHGFFFSENELFLGVADVGGSGGGELRSRMGWLLPAVLGWFGDGWFS